MTARDSSTSAQRICPKCGHANSNISLFCAECGAVLNGASTGETSAFAPVRTAADASQQTQPVRSGGSAEDEWASLMASSADDAPYQATAPLPKTTPPTSTVTPMPSAASPASAADDPWAPPSTPTPGDPASTLTGSSGNVTTGDFATGMPITSADMAVMPQSRRGFWFGIVAFVLILLVLGLYGWSILPDGGFRDTVVGWF